MFMRAPAVVAEQGMAIYLKAYRKVMIEILDACLTIVPFRCWALCEERPRNAGRVRTTVVVLSLTSSNQS